MNQALQGNLRGKMNPETLVHNILIINNKNTQTTPSLFQWEGMANP